jgi:hypothetical protein
MQVSVMRRLGYLGSVIACFFMALSVGCASGGFKLTRQYAGFVNKQDLIIRIVLYILTGVVFAATMLIDMVFFNTMDFWEGRVSAGDYMFNQGEKTYHAHHEVLPESNLKRSTIEVFSAEKKLLQTVMLQETKAGEIEFYVDGKLRTKVRDISNLPIASIYDAKGKLVSEELALVKTMNLAHQ